MIPFYAFTTAVKPNFIVKDDYLLPIPPPKPLTPYNRFMKEIRPLIKTQFPNLKPQDAFKKVSELYKDPNYEKIKKD